MFRSFLATFLFFFLVSCDEGGRIEQFKGSTMGTYYSVKIVGDSVDRKNLKREIELVLEHVNDVFSTYLDTSEVSRFNRLEAGKPMKISPEFERLLILSKKVSQNTDGYFDVTVGPIVNAWGFGPEGKKKRPSSRKIKKLKESLGMDKLVLKDAEASKKNPRLYVDLSAVAKGFGVDVVYETLKAKGFDGGLVEIGGEVRAFGQKPGGSSWMIGIEKPGAELGSGIMAVVALDDMSMATSGSYRNYVKYGDEVFSHTIDPVKGRPARNNVISVTVLAENCASADAYATAFLAMGAERGLPLAKKLGLPAYFIVKKEGKPAIIMTENFKPYLRGN